MKPDIEVWNGEHAAFPESRSHLNIELDAFERRLCAVADYGHHARARELLKSYFRIAWDFERKLKKLAPLDDRYFHASRDKTKD